MFLIKRKELSKSRIHLGESVGSFFGRKGGLFGRRDRPQQQRDLVIVEGGVLLCGDLCKLCHAFNIADQTREAIFPCDQFEAKAMKGGDREVVAWADMALDLFGEAASGLFAVNEDEDLRGIELAGSDQIKNAMKERISLSCTGACDNLKWRAPMLDGAALLGVEACEQFFGQGGKRRPCARTVGGGGSSGFESRGRWGGGAVECGGAGILAKGVDAFLDDLELLERGVG